MSRVLSLSLTPSDMERAIREIRSFEKYITEKTTELLRRLAERGVELMRVKFDGAAYDGTKEVDCSFVQGSDNSSVMVVAIGKSVLFIEFGTGIRDPEPHPDPASAMYPRGSWSESAEGKGHWDDPNGWWYAHGQHSFGNTANMSMYQTIRDLEDEFEQIVRSVFV